MKIKRWITLGLILAISLITICAEGQGCWGQKIYDKEGIDTGSGSSRGGGGGGSSGGGGGGSSAESSPVNIGPGKATNPYPAVGALGVSRTLNATNGELRYDAPADADSTEVYYVVYFGTNNPPTDDDWLVEDAEDENGDGRVIVDLGAYLLEALSPRTNYYWRVDSIGPDGETEGDIWWFVTQ
jgi:hypothetical protein